MIPLNFAIFINFLTPFLKLLGLQKRVPKTSAALSVAGKRTVVAEKRATLTTVKIPFPPRLNAV
jgi:hypothetical protein